MILNSERDSIIKVRINGSWVFGGIQRGTKNMFFEVVKDRLEKTLMELMRRRVKIGSHVYSDMWKGYKDLHDSGFLHSTVNHSRNSYHHWVFTYRQ
jgi:transposase-like protein